MCLTVTASDGGRGDTTIIRLREPPPSGNEFVPARTGDVGLGIDFCLRLAFLFPSLPHDERREDLLLAT